MDSKLCLYKSENYVNFGIMLIYQEKVEIISSKIVEIKGSICGSADYDLVWLGLLIY